MKFLKVFLASLMLMALCVYAEAQDANDVAVAKVGNITISVLDVQMEMQKLIPMQMSFHSGLKQEKLKEISGEALQNLIDRALKVQYAISEEISVDSQALAEKWDAFKSSNADNFSRISAILVEKYRADIYFDLLAKKAESTAVDAHVNISDQEVKNYYDKNKSNYVQPKLYRASHIFVEVDPSSNAEEIKAKKERAESLLQKVKSGEDFYNLAYYESDDRSKYVGGSLGSFHAGQTVEEFDRAINDMKPGEISDLVRTMYGFHIIKLDSVEEEHPLSFEDAAKLIRQTLERDQRKDLYEKWMEVNRDKFPVTMIK